MYLLATLPSEMGTTATAMAGPHHPLSPAQPCTAQAICPSAKAHAPLCPQTSWAMGSPVNPSISPSSSPTPAHSPPSSQQVCKAPPRAAWGSRHHWDMGAPNARDAEAVALSFPVWQWLKGLFRPSPHLQADHFSSQHGRLQPHHQTPLHQSAAARGQKLRGNAVNSPTGIYKAKSSNFYAKSGKGKWLGCFFSVSEKGF